MALRLMTPPAIEPISLTDAKTHLRVESDEEDTLITGLITSAREYCEDFQNQVYITQTWQFWLDSWPDRHCVRIPLPPLQKINSIKYYGVDNVEYVMPSTDYFVDEKSKPGRLVLAHGKAWPSVNLRLVNGVCIEFVAGYGDMATDVPTKVKQVMLFLIGHWHENREPTVAGVISREVQFTVNSLLWLNRVVPI